MIIPGMNTNTDGKVEETSVDIAITTITIIKGINKDLFTLSILGSKQFFNLILVAVEETLTDGVGMV
jgi:hypothetical protein